MKALRVVLTFLVLAAAGASAVRGAEPGVSGIASTWAGPGAATHDCVWPWKNCASRAVQSLDTGLVILVTPTMYCDCFVGRVGPNGETERLIDLDPSMVRALGLDPAVGLWRVTVWPFDPATAIDYTPPDQDIGIPDTAAASALLSPILVILLGWLALAVAVLLGINAYRSHLEGRRRVFRGSQVEEIVGWLE